MLTIGQRLKQAREAKRLTLEKVFEATRIRIPYLQALEADDHTPMPSPVQARGYLRNYAEYLELDFDQLLEDVRIQAQNDPSDGMITPMDSPASSRTPPPASASLEESTPPAKPRPVRSKKSPSRSPFARSDSTPVSQPGPSGEPGFGVEPVAKVEAETPPAEHSTQQDINETLWQTWLNRLSSIVSASSTRSDQPRPEETPPSAEILAGLPTSETPQNEPDSESTSRLSSAEIFVEIGAALRKRRELLSLHVDEVERNTHVKAHYLTALEEGAMDDLPSTVQTRGMLSNYATFLDLDVDSILLRYADALQARHRERNPQKPARNPGDPIVSRIPPIRSFIAGDIVFGFGIAILLIGFTVWGVSRVMTILNEEEIRPTAPSISDVLLSTIDPSLFTPTATLAPVEGGLLQPTITIVIPTQNLDINVQVNLIAVERSYMRVIVDGQQVFNGRVVVGNAYPFEAEAQVEVLVGSGAAIRVVYNGRDLGLMGDFGQVVNNIYREEEIVTPTALPTQIPSSTLTPTATVPATSTPVPSRTPFTTGTP